MYEIGMYQAHVIDPLPLIIIIIIIVVIYKFYTSDNKKD